MKKLVFLFLLCSHSLFAAIAVDGTPSTNSVYNTATITVSHTIVSSSTILIVGTAIDDDLATATGVTYNGVALTQISAISNNPNVRTELWRTTSAPATGAHNIVVTYSNATHGWCQVMAAAFTGVHTTTPLGTPATGNASTNGTSLSVSSASGELVVDIVGVGSGPAITVGTGQTQIPGMNLVQSTDISSGMSTEPWSTGSTVTMTWTFTGTLNWTGIGVSLKPAATTSIVPVLVSSQRRRRNQ